MQVISHANCESVAGGNPIALLGLGLGVLSSAGPLRDFFDGFFDGMGRL